MLVALGYGTAGATAGATAEAWRDLGPEVAGRDLLFARLTHRGRIGG